MERTTAQGEKGGNWLPFIGVDEVACEQGR